MQDKSDAELLRGYVTQASEAAFREIVTRHADLVYAAALRQVSSPELARDIAQTVFAELVRKAPALALTLAENASLVGWLYRCTRFEAHTQLRDDRRRQARERQAMENFDPTPETATEWERVGPVLDEAMDDLSDEDREALLLRFFKNHDFRAIGVALGVSDDAAQKRVSRALDQLRAEFHRRGVTTTAVALATAVSANAVSVGPAGLAATLSTAALTGTTLTTAATATAIKAITMTTLQKTIIGAVLAAAVGTGIYETRQASTLRNEVQTLHQQQAPLVEQIQQLQRDREEAKKRLVALTDEIEKMKGNASELLKLRGLVASLRGDTNLINDPSVQAALAWVAKKQKLQKIFADSPDQRIPEMKILTETQWLDFVKDLELDTEGGIHHAIGFLRTAAKTCYAPIIQLALKKFIEANNGNLPNDVSQLSPFFDRPDQPVDNSILARYTILDNATNRPGWLAGMVLVEKVAGDKWTEPRFAIGPEANSSTMPPEPMHLTFPLELKPAMDSYRAQNQQKVPSDFNELRPYLTTPEQQAALDKLIKELAAVGK